LKKIKISKHRRLEAAKVLFKKSVKDFYGSLIFPDQVEFSKLNIGKISSVLFEKTRNEGLLTGFTSNYLKIEYPWDSKLADTIKKAKLKRILDNGRINIEIID
jgi:hypothetical protein